MNQRSHLYTVVGIGEVLWDMLPTGKLLGGAPANCAYHAHAQGARARVVSAVGDDALGHELLDALEHKGLSTAYVEVLKGVDTGTVTVELSGVGIPQYTIHEGVAWDHVPLTAEMLTLAQSTDAVCYGSLAQRSEGTRKTIRGFLQATRKDCLRVFDINIRQEELSRSVLEESLALATILKLNDEELPYLAQLFDLGGEVENQLGQLLDRFELELIAYTRGAQGCILINGTEAVDVPGGKAIEVADTVGAGDAFTAALIVAYLDGDGVATMARRAHERAGWACTRAGGMPEPD